MKIVTAMAFSRSDAEDHISYLSLKIAQHVIKLFLFPDSPHVKGWTREVRAWYLTCRKYGNNLKGGKSFKAKEYMSVLYSIPFKSQSDVREYQEQAIEQNEKLAAKQIDAHELRSMITALYMTMCEALAADEDWLTFVKKLQDYTGTD